MKRIICISLVLSITLPHPLLGQKKLIIKKVDSKREWEAYYGTDEITEIQFFEITNHATELEKAKSYKRVSSVLEWSGILSFATGIGLIVVGIINEEPTYDEYIGYSNERKPNHTMILLGVSIATFGGISLISSSIREGKNWAPYGLAQEIADEYNAQLRIQIEKNF